MVWSWSWAWQYHEKKLKTPWILNKRNFSKQDWVTNPTRNGYSRDICRLKENLQEDFDIITESPKIVKSYPPKYKLLWIALFVLSAPQSDIWGIWLCVGIELQYTMTNTMHNWSTIILWRIVQTDQSRSAQDRLNSTNNYQGRIIRSKPGDTGKILLFSIAGTQFESNS